MKAIRIVSESGNVDSVLSRFNDIIEELPHINFKFAEIQSSNIVEKNSSNDKQIQFLTEQNKSYQKDIDTLNKSKNELMNKIKEIQSAKCGIEEQLISKEREIMKYRTLCNRLKLKIKEISSSK